MVFDLPKGLKSLELEAFEPCVGEEFDVASEPIAVKIRLDHIVKHKGGPGFLTRAPFTLIWSSVPSINLKLGIYSLSITPQRHCTWGPHQVYIERMMAMGERPVYQSVFF